MNQANRRTRDRNRAEARWSRPSPRIPDRGEGRGLLPRPRRLAGGMVRAWPARAFACSRRRTIPPARGASLRRPGGAQRLVTLTDRSRSGGSAHVGLVCLGGSVAERLPVPHQPVPPTPVGARP